MNNIVVLPVLFVIVLVLYFKVLRSRELLGDVLIVSSGVFFFVLFVEFALYGKIYAWEPSRYVAGFEAFLALFVTVLGLERFWKDLQSEG